MKRTKNLGEVLDLLEQARTYGKRALAEPTMDGAITPSQSKFQAVDTIDAFNDYAAFCEEGASLTPW
jgi:hypothetical protein